MPARHITRDEVIEAFMPVHDLLTATIRYAREQTTAERYKNLHPEIAREAGRSRLSGQARWQLLADGLVSGLPAVDGFGVRSSEAQHNSGQFVFSFPGGIFTVRREPHDRADPEDGRYIQEAFAEILEQAVLSDGVDADAPIVAYLSVAATTAVLKVCHPTLTEVMKIAVSDLQPTPQSIPSPLKPRRARARSTRTDKRRANGTGDAPDLRS